MGMAEGPFEIWVRIHLQTSAGRASEGVTIDHYTSMYGMVRVSLLYRHMIRDSLT